MWILLEYINKGGLYLDKKINKFSISILVFLLIFLCFTGCADKKKVTLSKETIEETGDSMTNLTYEVVKELNKKSDLLGINLLDAAPPEMIVPGPEQFGTGEDYFCCFPFDGEYRITEIDLLSETANVFGIAVGNSLVQVDETLRSEGFKKLGVEESKNYAPFDENLVVYKTGYITLVFILGENENTTTDDIITNIVIIVDNPSEKKPTF